MSFYSFSCKSYQWHPKSVLRNVLYVDVRLIMEFSLEIFVDTKYFCKNENTKNFSPATLYFSKHISDYTIHFCITKQIVLFIFLREVKLDTSEYGFQRVAVTLFSSFFFFQIFWVLFTCINFRLKWWYLEGHSIISVAFDLCVTRSSLLAKKQNWHSKNFASFFTSKGTS